MENRVIFEHQLAIVPEKSEKLGILTQDSLFWWQQGEKKQLALKDVVGVSVVNQEKENDPCLVVHAYPVVETGYLFKKRRRVLKEYYFTCPSQELRPRNLGYVQSQWQQAINNTLVGKPIDVTVQPRRLQIILNPVSGRGKATQIFQQVRPLLDCSYLEYTVTETSSAADTKNLVFHLNLAEIDGIVIVGGDGTIHDAIAGLMSRPDWETAIKTPLGIIPGGTGNGLCKTVLELAGESYDPLNAAFLIVKGKQQALDLAAVKQNDQKYYSCLSLAWGLVSDIDIQSEKLKFLGSLRFELYALILICLRRTYKGRLAFMPHPDFQLSQPSTILKPGEWQIIEDEFIFLWAVNTPWAAHDMQPTPYAQLNDGAIDIVIMRKATSRLELLKALIRVAKGQHLSLPHLEYYQVCSLRLEPLTKKGILVVDGEPVDYSPIEMTVMPNLACINC